MDPRQAVIDFPEYRIAVHVSAVVNIVRFLIKPIEVKRIRPIIQHLDFMETVADQTIIRQIFGIQDVAVITQLPGFLVDAQFGDIIAVAHKFIASVILQIGCIIKKQVNEITVGRLLNQIDQLLDRNRLYRKIGDG